ncbi:MAG: NAD-dependent epimerase/dehydratase family protein [Gammaproteobacteria bacterium]|nr:NAD-dependent epimerase/dehydratase family protein [Gammaproteobacteria bacterium]
MHDSIRSMRKNEDNSGVCQALVSGASGFIGGHLCEALVQNGYRVAALVRDLAIDNASSGSIFSNKWRTSGQSVKVFTGDLAKPETLLTACHEMDYVFHLAGTAHTAHAEKKELRKTIVEGTVNFASVAKQSGVRSFVYFSSSLAATIDKEQATSYASCKKAAEQAVLAMADEQFRVCVLRPVNVYGSGMKGNIAALLRRIRSGTMPPLPKLGNHLSLISVQDLCEAAILAAQREDSTGHIYSVNDGLDYTPNDLEMAIYRALGKNRPAWYTPRMVFFLAAVGAQIVNKLGLWRNDLGLRTYRNLTGAGHRVDSKSGIKPCQKCKQQDHAERNAAELGFQPQRSFQDELPKILSAL